MIQVGKAEDSRINPMSGEDPSHHILTGWRPGRGVALFLSQGDTNPVMEAPHLVT